jgi:hypothetical protein
MRPVEGRRRRSGMRPVEGLRRCGRPMEGRYRLVRERESGGVRGVKVGCFEIKTGQKVWMVGPTRWVVGR